MTTVLSLAASTLGAFGTSMIVRGQSKFHIEDI